MSFHIDTERDAPSTDGPQLSKLLKFRQMTGINAPPRLALNHPDRPGPNIGIYARVISEEKKATLNYWLMSTIINMSFFGQIIVAATLTALGASNASHIAITVLGSLNTVIAGIQTYLKGQGLPNRIQQYQFSLRKLREHIEDREREFAYRDCMLDVDHVIADVAAMYQAVRQTAEDNTPDTYLPSQFLPGYSSLFMMLLVLWLLQLVFYFPGIPPNELLLTVKTNLVAGAGKKLLGQNDSQAGAVSAPTGSTSVAQPLAVQAGAVQPGADAAANIDAVAAAENAEAQKAKGKEETKVEESKETAKADEAKDAGQMDKTQDGEASGTSPNHEDDTEDAPLLKSPASES